MTMHTDDCVHTDLVLGEYTPPGEDGNPVVVSLHQRVLEMQEQLSMLEHEIADTNTERKRLDAIHIAPLRERAGALQKEHTRIYEVGSRLADTIAVFLGEKVVR